MLSVLTRVKVVLLVDDSGSMQSRIWAPLSGQTITYNPRTGRMDALMMEETERTRWEEAKATTSLLTELVDIASPLLVHPYYRPSKRQTVVESTTCETITSPEIFPEQPMTGTSSDDTSLSVPPVTPQNSPRTMKVFKQDAEEEHTQQSRTEEDMRNRMLVSQVYRPRIPLDSNRGLDIWFLNRPGMANVTSMEEVEQLFAIPPGGRTPLIGSVRHIIDTYRHICSFENDEHVLLLIIGDGEPSDGHEMSLKQVFDDKPLNFHITFIECNDDQDEMEWMDSLEGRIHNFHNCDDYRLEALKIGEIHGAHCRYNYEDYLTMAILSTFVKEHQFLSATRPNRLKMTKLPHLCSHPPPFRWLADRDAPVSTDLTPLPEKFWLPPGGQAAEHDQERYDKKFKSTLTTPNKSSKHNKKQRSHGCCTLC